MGTRAPATSISWFSFGKNVKLVGKWGGDMETGEKKDFSV